MNAAMALVDYIPVGMFLVSAIILQRDLYGKMSKGAFAVFSAGTIMVFTAGFYKATWKLLLGLGICDFEKLGMAFMPMQATGFFLIAAAIIALFFFKQGSTTAMALAAPMVYSGTAIFVSMMCAGIGVLCAGLSVMAMKLGKKRIIAVFILTFFAMLAMGYLSSKDFEDPMMNWLAEGVNIIGQGSLLFGAVSLRKAGLKDLQIG